MSIRIFHKSGFEDGYNASINAKPKQPKPDITASLVFEEYLASYMTGYDEGYAQAKSDRALLLQGREQTEEWRLHENLTLENRDV